jgi:ribosomal protein S27AE
MASVQDSIDCPQCGGKAILEVHTRTLAESIFCPRCGYSEQARPLIDRQKQKADAQHREWFKRRKDGEPIFRTTKRPGFGAYMLAQQNGVSALGVVNCKLTAKMIVNFKRDIAKPEMDAARSFLTRWNPKTQQVETVVGQIPPDLL